MQRFKVFIPYAWGAMNEEVGLGGAFANIIVGSPNEICTETYLESGCFSTKDEAVKHAKFLLTKFARALLYLNKYSQHSTTAWGDVPLMSYKEDFWNESIECINNHLMDMYNIPQYIRQFVNDNIQTKDESNIVNL